METKEIKTGKVVSCTYKGEWLNPINKTIIYYHDVLTDKGDSGNCGTYEKYSAKIKKGAIIEFEIDPKGKIKLLSSSSDNNNYAKPKNNNSSSSFNRIKGQETFLGYAWSYSKDLIIAGKTMKDIEELNKVARFIYDEMGKMLKNEK
jgi:hypothetical protein